MMIENRHPKAEANGCKQLSFSWISLRLACRPSAAMKGADEAEESTNKQMVEPVGIEPTTPCLQSRCSPS